MPSSCHEWHLNVDSLRGDLSGNSGISMPETFTPDQRGHIHGADGWHKWLVKKDDRFIDM